MFECSACTLRCIRAVAGDTVNTQHLARRSLLQKPKLTNTPLRRHASVAVRTAPPDGDAIPFDVPIWKQRDTKNKDGTKVAVTAASTKESELKEDTKKRPNAITIENKSALKKELEWLGDRVKLAAHVHYVLRNNDPEKALNLCRLASANQEVIVSWNHVVDWYMQNGKPDQALKVYNEMKKRAQFPDAHTYTLLLRGLALPQEGLSGVTTKNMNNALSIYNSLSSPTSRVKPNIYHTNAVLKVCAEANKMDHLWGVVAKLPDHGSSAPDHVTYGIILNAIKNNAFGPSRLEGSSPDAAVMRQNRALSEARAVWRDMVARWRAGEVKFDEVLVVDMGKLLLESPRMQDWDDVLNLVQQTTNIQRLVPPLGSPDRNEKHVPQLKSPEESNVPEEDADGWQETPAGKAFLPVKPLLRDGSPTHRTMSLAWVRPGNLMLSLVLNACNLMCIPKTAVQYWDALTSHPYNVRPDYGTFHTMLRLLRRNRQSAKALALVRDTMPAASQKPVAMTYVLAMATCVRDLKNRNALDYARELVDLMIKYDNVKTSQHISVEALVAYIMLSLSTDSAEKITRTLDHLHPIMEQLAERVNHKHPSQNAGRSTAKHGTDPKIRETQMIVHLFRTAAGVIDALRDSRMLTPEEVDTWTEKRIGYQRFVSGMMRHKAIKDQAESLPARLKRPSGEGEHRDVAGEGSKVAIGRTEPALQAFRRRNPDQALQATRRKDPDKAGRISLERDGSRGYDTRWMKMRESRSSVS